MTMKINAYATPHDILSGNLDGAAAVVIDTLRMTSVAAAAMESGCTGLFACAEVEEARRVAGECGALLGGERNALKIDGFDFSNSPLEYTPQAIGGRRLVMSTSNGTRAIAACAQARRLLLGAMINARAVADALHGEAHVALVCAGTNGAFTLEDALTVGAIVEHLQGAELDDAALAFQILYRAARDDLFGALSATAHFSRLRRLGFEDDLRFCLNPDSMDALCERSGDGWFRRV